MLARSVVVLTLAILLAGCAQRSDRPASTLTEAQRDSVLAREPIPGASAVGRAMQAAGREERRAERMDSLANGPSGAASSR